MHLKIEKSKNILSVIPLSWSNQQVNGVFLCFDCKCIHCCNVEKRVPLSDVDCPCPQGLAWTFAFRFPNGLQQVVISVTSPGTGRRYFNWRERCVSVSLPSACAKRNFSSAELLIDSCFKPRICCFWHRHSCSTSFIWRRRRSLQ